MERFCVKCGHKFITVGREVICPACKQQAAEEAKKAAVMRAKQASWRGESVPVRISGRASTVIRRYGAAHDMPFATALDVLLLSTGLFKNLGVAWQDVTPYKSRRMQKSTDGEQDAPQDKPQEAQEEKQAAKKAVKTSKAAGRRKK